MLIQSMSEISTGVLYKT